MVFNPQNLLGGQVLLLVLLFFKEKPQGGKFLPLACHGHAGEPFLAWREALFGRPAAVWFRVF